jgi:hypothetical protein
MSLPVDAPGPYALRLLNRLADRDPVSVLDGTPASLRAAFDGLADDAVRRPEAPGKWSMIHVASHLADGEMVVGVRIRMIVAHDRPPITAYDQDLWADNLHYGDARLADVLDQFTSLRAATVRFARRLTRAELDRYGVHEERGGESVDYMLRLLAGHDLVHLDQLARIRRAA